MVSAKPPSDDSPQLPEWAIKALAATSAKLPAQPPSIESLRTTAAWPLLLDAAVVSTFLPKDLAPGATADASRSSAEETVLGYADTEATSDGLRWELRRDARAEILRLALDGRELRPVLARTAERFRDAVSAALRATLSGESTTQSETSDLASLEALRVATSALGGLQAVRPPIPLRTLDRVIRKRRLVEQFEHICGKDYRTGVVGRTEELEYLRAYVGVIAAEGFGARLSRGIGHVRRVVTGKRPPLAIWGTGGVGKTTLLARFMLEHIDAADRSYPIAYLDFDRPSISPQDHFGLFAEICLQVSAQFEELDASLRALREEALNEQTDNPTVDSDELLEGLLEKFRQQLDGFLDKQESFFEWNRPVLIVLDTFEVVQYDANQVKHLERFLRVLLRSKWSRLRLIVAGRKKIDRLAGAVDSYELQGIDTTGATELLVRLSEQASKPVPHKRSQELAELLAVRRTALDEPRVHPLRLRMLAEIFRSDERQSGLEIARELIKELRGGLKEGGSAARSLINGILIRRIVDHVRDPKVRALADPGLVVRRITPEVIQQVMAMATPRPGAANDALSDSVQFEPWTMDLVEARQIYKAFSKEVSLVERDGIALRHRQDVRSEMLPLIRARSPNRYKQLHALGFEYFKKEAKGAKGEKGVNVAAAAEAIYHGLWSGRDLEELDRIWTDSDVLSARIDPEEFEPDSLADLFLKAKNRKGLTVQEALRLPPSIGRSWAIDFGDRFLLTDDPGATFKVIEAATRPELEGVTSAPDLLAATARILFRMGAWRDCHELIQRLPDKLRGTRGRTDRGARASLARLAVHLALKSGVPIPLAMDDVMSNFPMFDSYAKVEVASHLLLGRPLSVRQVRPIKESLDRALADVPRTRWASSRNILRLGILASESPRPELVATWVNLTDRLPRFRDPAGTGRKLQGVLTEVLESRRITSLDGMDVLWQERKADVARRLSKDANLLNRVCYLVAFDHSDWLPMIAYALHRELEEAGDVVRPHLSKLEFKPSPNDDGPHIVQRAWSEGRFLDLAKGLSSLPEHRTGRIPESWKYLNEKRPYPNSVAELSHALLDWHAMLLNRASSRLP